MNRPAMKTPSVPLVPWIWNQGRKEQWRGMRAGDYKLLRSTDSGPWQLFDLSKVVGEQTDLAARRPE
jgi:hypothetical protein